MDREEPDSTRPVVLGVAEELIEKNNDVLKQILESAAAGRETDEKAIGDYYASCMDEPAIDAKGASALDPPTRIRRRSTA